MLYAFEDVYRERSRHAADELHRDDDPQMREHALEDDLYAGTVHDGVPVIDHVHPGGLMRVDVVGDLRTGVLDAVALSVQAHRFVEAGLGVFEIENLCSFHGEFLLFLGNLANPFIYTVNRGHLWGRKDAMF